MFPITSQLIGTSRHASKLQILKIGKLHKCLSTLVYRNRHATTGKVSSHLHPILQISHGNGLKHVRFMSSKEKESMKTPVTWNSLTISAVVVSLCLGILYALRQDKDMAKEKLRRETIGKSKIVSQFNLIDTEGKPRKSVDFMGKWCLVYFGFTNCPDICPEELEKISEVTKYFESDSKMPEVQPLFITVDPERDTPADIKKYLAEFHPKMIGLTGTYDQIAEACKAYRVYWSAGPKDQDNDYIVDHTIIVYLVDPDGQFIDYFGQTKTADEMILAIKLKMMAYIKNKK